MLNSFGWKTSNQNLREQGLFRSIPELEPDLSRPGRTRFENRSLVLLSSNDYLGLSLHPRLREAAIDAIRRFGFGSGSARLVSGNNPLIAELESRIAEFKGTESALVFNSGYAANLGFFSGTLSPEDLILADRLCHASLIDGCRLSGARLRIFPHGNIKKLSENLAKRRRDRSPVIVTEGLFSMDGDIPPLPEMIQTAEKHDALIYLDDAHATGVLGKSGRGTLDHFNLSGETAPERVIQMGTFGKAFGSLGSFIAGKREMVDHLINNARTFIYTTALPAAAAAASLEALRIIREEPEHLDRLRTNITQFREGLRSLGFKIPGGESPIIPIPVGDAKTAVAFSDTLREKGVFAPAIRPPTVPKGTSRIRISIMSAHTPEDLDLSLEAISAAGRQLGLV